MLAGLHYSSITRDLENSITAQAQLGEGREGRERGKGERVVLYC